MPAGVEAGAVFDNTAGVRSYEATANTGVPLTYVPSNNIDTTLTPNTDRADDVARVFVAPPTIDKVAVTSVDEAGNSPAAEATIGETISYSVTVTIPEGASVYGPAVISDDLGTLTTYVPGSAAGTLNGGVLPAGFTLSEAANVVSLEFPAGYNNPPLSGPDDVVVTFAVTVDDIAGNARTSAIPNRADFVWEDIAGSPTTVSDSLSTTVVEPNLSIAKAHDDTDGIVDPGQTVGYTLTVTNAAGASVSTGHEIVVTDVVTRPAHPARGSGRSG